MREWKDIPVEPRTVNVKEDRDVLDVVLNWEQSSATPKPTGEGHDGKDVLAKRMQARAEHVARLTVLRDQGRLLLAGPCPAIDAEDPGPAGFSGSIVIAEFQSLDEARAWAGADPYVDAGVYSRVDVRPFKPVLP